MKFEILTLFPEVVEKYAETSILSRGQKNESIKIDVHNFRDYTSDKHNKVDDSPYGGGAGMLISPQPIYSCLENLGLVKGGKKVKIKNTKIIIMDPAGKKFDQKMANRFSKLDRLVLISGRYEGFDARVYKFIDERVSVGDYVLAGGELSALIITEATARLVPGVLGNPESLTEESHNLGVKKIKKEYPQYTRPEIFMGLKVPKILLSGDHKKIEEWRDKKVK